MRISRLQSARRATRGSEMRGSPGRASPAPSTKTKGRCGLVSVDTHPVNRVGGSRRHAATLLPRGLIYSGCPKIANRPERLLPRGRIFSSCDGCRGMPLPGIWGRAPCEIKRGRAPTNDFACAYALGAGAEAGGGCDASGDAPSGAGALYPHSLLAHCQVVPVRFSTFSTM
jgi:hypothetical protein